MPSRLGSLSCHCAIGQHAGCEVSQRGKKNQSFEPRKIHILLKFSTAMEGNATIKQV